MKKVLLICLPIAIVIAAVAAFLIINGGSGFKLDLENTGSLSDSLMGNAEIISDGEFFDSVVSLDGTPGYISLPKNILKDKMTFIIWAKRNGVTANEHLLDLGSGSDNYFFISPSTGSAEIMVNGEKGWLGMPTLDEVGEWQMIVVTANDYEISYYINGESRGGTRTSKFKLSEVKNTENYIGKSRFEEQYFNGLIGKVEIIDGVLSEEEIKKMYLAETNVSALRAKANELAIPDHIYENMDLSKFEGVQFKSSNQKVLSNDGIVNAKNQDTEVTLTAILTDEASGAEYERDFVITVVANGAKGRVEYIKNHLDIGISYIYDDIKLPSEIDGAKITWRSSECISPEGVITHPDTDKEVTLIPTVSFENESTEGEIKVMVAGKTSAYLCTYISTYEYNTGVEFAEFPSHNYTDNARTDIMFYAISEDGKTFKGINNDRAVLYPYSSIANFGTPFEFKFGSPSLFRKPDGNYGLVAANDNITSQILLYDSTDLINFENQRVIDLGIIVKNPEIRYDNETKLFTLYFESDDGSYFATTSDLKSFSAIEKCDYKKTLVEAELPIYAKADEAAIFELTQAEYDRIMKKYGGLYSVSVSYEKELQADAGKAVELPMSAVVNYNDGSTKEMGIVWDLESAGIDLDNPKAGTYQINGKINRPVYESPLAECRADPYVIYNEQDGMYYFTSSYMQSDCQNAYAYVIIRRAKTINELKTAEEVIIWDSSRGSAKAWYWAPELHYFGGQWRMILLSTWEDTGWEATLLSCKKGGDMLDPQNWSAERIGGDPKGQKLGAFDTTFFEYEGKCYYVTPSGNNIWIAEFDPENPLVMTTDLVKIGGASYSWEYNNGFPGTICDHQYVNEASSIMIHNGKIYLTYAGSTIDMHYCIGLLYCDLDDDFMDPANWKKHPLPLLVTADLTTTIKEPTFAENGDTLEDGEYVGSFGPGHNSITYDENGNPVVIYHARVWGEHFVSSGEQYGLGDPGRHAFARSVNFDIDGIPVMNLSPEQELAPSLENVTITVTISE